MTIGIVRNIGAGLEQRSKTAVRVCRWIWSLVCQTDGDCTYRAAGIAAIFRCSAAMHSIPLYRAVPRYAGVRSDTTVPRCTERSVIPRCTVLDGATSCAERCYAVGECNADCCLRSAFAIDFRLQVWSDAARRVWSAAECRVWSAANCRVWSAANCSVWSAANCCVWSVVERRIRALNEQRIASHRSNSRAHSRHEVCHT